MIIQPDFKELLHLLVKNNVEYMIVGGYAVAFYGYPRFTKDLAIFYRLTPENVERLSAALVEFGFPYEKIAEARLLEKGDLVAFGIPPVRVNLINQIDGISFETAASNTVETLFGDIKVHFIGRSDLIKNKQSTSRLQDRLDAEKLSEHDDV